MFFYLFCLIAGGMPYPNICNNQILDHLLSGYRMQRPEICSEDLYRLIRLCWSEDPDERPFFSEIVEKFEMPDDEFSTGKDPIYVNFDELAPNYAFPPTKVYDQSSRNFVEFGETSPIIEDV